MTKEDYQKLLDNHDWHYQYSDDNREYSKGRDERMELRRIANTDTDYALMYEQKVWEVCSNGS